jgi:hypothetical protein
MTSDRRESGHMTGHCEFPKGTWQSPYQFIRLLRFTRNKDRRACSERSEVIFSVPRDNTEIIMSMLITNYHNKRRLSERED